MKQDNKYFDLIDLIVMALLVVQMASANYINYADDATQNKSSTAENVFNFPEDHVLHQPEEIVKNSKLFSEWLYWTGILHDINTGELYGFQYTLFQMDLTPGSMAFINHAAISDVRNSQHPLFGYSIFPDQANITNGEDGSKGSFWLYEDNQTTLIYWMDLDAWNIHSQGNVSMSGGQEQKISQDLNLVNDKAGYFLQTPTGINTQGLCFGVGSENMSGRSYYYSHPAMKTTGNLTIGERKINVSGYSWFDHQWGGFRQCYPAWDWFSLRLDDGSFIMLYDLKDLSMNSIPGQRSLTYIDPMGNVTWWHGESAANLTVERWWTPYSSSSKYPADWVLDTPVGTFALEPYFDDQNMDVPGSPIRYWEGIMRVRAGDLKGEQIGTGYLEMTGYEPISDLMKYYAFELDSSKSLRLPFFKT
jgi:predicted secreted hydrolase